MSPTVYFRSEGVFHSFGKIKIIDAYTSHLDMQSCKFQVKIWPFVAYKKIKNKICIYLNSKNPIIVVFLEILPFFVHAIYNRLFFSLKICTSKYQDNRYVQKLFQKI
jgi:hypothetical protein